AFNWETEPPDPQEEETYKRSKIQWKSRESGNHRLLLNWHRVLITMRKTLPALATFNKNFVQVNIPAPGLLVVNRQSEAEDGELTCIFNFSKVARSYIFQGVFNRYRMILDSMDKQYSKQTDLPSFEHPKEICKG